MLSTNKNFSDKDKDILLEALKENWASARYHESTRWKYFYFYFAAVGGILIYFSKEYLDGSINLSPLCASQSLVISLVSFFLGVVGFIALGHLLYANAEYGNHLRAIQYIARDLGLNRGIEKYLKEREKDFNVKACEIKILRSTYMALPLHLEIRGKLGNIILYESFISVLFSISFYYLALFINKLNQFTLSLDDSYLVSWLFMATVILPVFNPSYRAIKSISKRVLKGCTPVVKLISRAIKWISKRICKDSNRIKTGQKTNHKITKLWRCIFRLIFPGLGYAMVILFYFVLIFSSPVIFYLLPQDIRDLISKNILLIFSLAIGVSVYFSLSCFVSLKHRLVAEETDARDPRKNEEEPKKYMRSWDE